MHGESVFDRLLDVLDFDDAYRLCEHMGGEKLKIPARSHRIEMARRLLFAGASDRIISRETQLSVRTVSRMRERIAAEVLGVDDDER